MEAEYDLYAAGGRRCLLSCNAHGQRRPFRFKRRGKLLYETDSNFLTMDGAAAGSRGRDYSPYSHGRHDADKGQLCASIQFDLVPKAFKKASVPGRGRLCDQPVTHYYDTGTGLSDGRAVQVDRADHMADHSQWPDAVEKLRRRHTEAHPVRLDSSGAGPSDLRHCYMCETRDTEAWYYWPPKRVADPQPPHHRVCEACKASLANGSRSTEPAAAGWSTSARTAHAVQMGAKVSRRRLSLVPPRRHHHTPPPHPTPTHGRRPHMFLFTCPIRRAGPAQQRGSAHNLPGRAHPPGQGLPGLAVRVHTRRASRQCRCGRVTGSRLLSWVVCAGQQ